jgi:uncharacterized membrane protein YuzA (DUF378 family)
MPVLDFTTLLLILAAGFELGTESVFGVSWLGWVFGGWRPEVYAVIGAASLWQLFRQRYFG